MDCSFFICSSLFVLHFVPYNNFLTSAMHKQAYHCSRFVVILPPQNLRLVRCLQRFENRLERRNHQHCS